MKSVVIPLIVFPWYSFITTMKYSSIMSTLRDIGLQLFKDTTGNPRNITNTKIISIWLSCPLSSRLSWGMAFSPLKLHAIRVILCSLIPPPPVYSPMQTGRYLLLHFSNETMFWVWIGSGWNNQLVAVAKCLGVRPTNLDSHQARYSHHSDYFIPILTTRTYYFMLSIALPHSLL